MAEQEQKGHKHHKHHLPEEVRQHMENARKEMHSSWATLLPPEFVAHRRRARKEMLLAARGLINHALERLETHEEAPE